jgi:hypothetical protein
MDEWQRASVIADRAAALRHVDDAPAATATSSTPTTLTSMTSAHASARHDVSANPQQYVICV